ncbi:MAG TPA: hypothetical protein VHX38_02885 [Pseudonocardiaceae bacterium]|jgi:hypothetical protein|nr:hypothetical protein [Pseudonocardiaceae bacterium]
MDTVFDRIVITDKRCLGAAPAIDDRGRCTFPTCGRPADHHVRFDADDSTEQIDPREYHRGKVGYYRDEVIGLAQVASDALAGADSPSRVLTDGIGVQVAAAAFAAGYRRVA